ncbi:MAG: sigma-70 family RNA polymerase sigma factor [Planctomycetota bacterium]|nr:sigma-70 family RNA polymerase sigma factor [Planctomycetota bacterium]
MRSEDFFEILVRQHASMLTAYLRSLAFDETLVDDAFQETLITAWRRIDEFDRERPFGPWMRGIARNTLLALARKKRRYKTHLVALLEERVAAQMNHIDARSGDTFAERMETLRDCIASLNEEHRDAVDLVYVRGMDSRTAATAAGLTDETFRKRLYRARLALADCLRTKGAFIDEVSA